MATNDVNLQVINSMTQYKMNSLKNAEGKIPELSNQIIMTDSEDSENYYKAGNGISIDNGVVSQKNSAITIQLSSAYEMPSKSQESPAMTQVVKVGDKLSFINNEIVVGRGVSVVRASSKAFYIPYAASSVYCYIVKNGSNLTIDTNYTASAKAMNIGTSNILIPVVEGDRIGIAFYTSASGSLQGGNYRTYLTVEVVE